MAREPRRAALRDRTRLDMSTNLLGLLEKSEAKKFQAIKNLREALDDNNRKVSRLSAIINRYSIDSLDNQMEEVVSSMSAAIQIEKSLNEINPHDPSLIIVNKLVDSLIKEYKIITRQISYVLNEYKNINDQIDDLSKKVVGNQPRVERPANVQIDKKVRDALSSRPSSSGVSRRSSRGGTVAAATAALENFLPKAAQRVFQQPTASFGGSVKGGANNRGFTVSQNKVGNIVINSTVASGSNSSNANTLLKEKRQQNFWSDFENKMHEDLMDIKKLLKLETNATEAAGSGLHLKDMIDGILEFGILKKLNPLSHIKNNFVRGAKSTIKGATRAAAGSTKVAIDKLKGPNIGPSKEALEKQLEEFRNMTGSKLNMLETEVESKWARISKQFENGINTVTKSIANKSPDAVKQISSLSKNLFEGFEDLKGNIIKWSGNTLSGLEGFNAKIGRLGITENPFKGIGGFGESLSNITSKALEGLSSVKSGVGSFLGDKATGIANFIGKSAEDASPWLKKVGNATKFLGPVAEAAGPVIGAATIGVDRNQLPGTTSVGDRVEGGVLGGTGFGFADLGGMALNKFTNMRIAPGAGTRYLDYLGGRIDDHLGGFNGAKVGDFSRAEDIAVRLFKGEKVSAEEIGTNPVFINKIKEILPGLADSQSIKGARGWNTYGHNYSDELPQGLSAADLNTDAAKTELNKGGNRSLISAGLQENAQNASDALDAYYAASKTGQTPDSVQNVATSKNLDKISGIVTNSNKSGPIGNEVFGPNLPDNSAKIGNEAFGPNLPAMNKPIISPITSANDPNDSDIPQRYSSDGGLMDNVIPAEESMLKPMSFTSTDAQVTTQDTNLLVKGTAQISLDRESARTLAEFLAELVNNSDNNKYELNPFKRRGGGGLMSNISYGGESIGGGNNFGNGSGGGGGGTPSIEGGSFGGNNSFTGSGGIGSSRSGGGAQPGDNNYKPIESHLGLGHLTPTGNNGFSITGTESESIAPSGNSGDSSFGLGPMGTDGAQAPMSVGSNSLDQFGKSAFGGGFDTQAPNDASSGPVAGATNNRLAESRAGFFKELDANPGTKKLFMQAALAEGPRGSMQANMEQMVNFAQAKGINSLNSALHSGQFGPVNRGQAQSKNLSDKDVAAGESAMDNIRKGSNQIQYRSDQGMPTDPGARVYLQQPGKGGHLKVGINDFYFHGGDQGFGAQWAKKQQSLDKSYTDSHGSLAPGVADSSNPSPSQFDSFNSPKPSDTTKSADGVVTAANKVAGNGDPWTGIKFGSAGPNSAQTSSNDPLKSGQQSALQRLQTATGQNFTITSTTGGQHAEHSQHYSGSATDISIRGKTPEQISGLIEGARRAGFTGIGVGRTHLHLDTRPTKDGHTQVFNDQNPGDGPVAGKTAAEWQNHLNKNIQPDIKQLNAQRAKDIAPAPVQQANTVSPSTVKDSGSDTSSDVSNATQSSDSSGSGIKSATQSADTDANSRIAPSVVGNNTDAPLGNSSPTPSKDSTPSDAPARATQIPRNDDNIQASNSSGGNQQTASASYATMHNDSLGMVVLNDPHLTG